MTIALESSVRCGGAPIFVPTPIPGTGPNVVAGFGGNIITAISAGAYHSVFLDNTEKVWATGFNQHGELGLGYDDADMGDLLADHIRRLGLSNITKISAGAYDSMALDGTNHVFAWGANTYGEAGDGTAGENKLPVPVTSLNSDGITAISEGSFQSVVLNGTNGHVWSWGFNGDGEVGDGTPTTLPRLSPVPLTSLNGDGITSISTGGYHTLALNASTGAVYSWGANFSGQVGDGTLVNKPSPTQIMTTTTGVIQVDAGSGDSFVVKNDGTLFGFGSNYYGQLGKGTYVVPSFAPRQMPVLNGTTPVSVTAIASGQDHKLGLDVSHQIWAWGNNSDGQLGTASLVGGVYTANYSNATQPVPVSSLSGVTINYIAAGYQHNLALDSNAHVWAWGNNAEGELGDGQASLEPKRSWPLQISGLNNVKAIAAGQLHSLTVDTSGHAKAWGDNIYGELGDLGASGTQSTTPVSVHLPSGTTFTTVSAGSNFSLALDSFQQVWAWGNNSSGQIGGDPVFGGTVVGPSPVPLASGKMFTAISAGGSHALALDSTGQVWAWGDNTYGQLGDGGASGVGTFNPENIYIPIAVGGKIVAIQAGGDYSLALDDQGNVWAWGGFAYNELGNGSASPVQISSLSGITALSGGLYSGLALKADKTVEGWGFDSMLQLGLGFNRIDPSSPYLNATSVAGFNLITGTPVVTVNITSPANNITTTVGTAVSLTATAARAGGVIQNVTYYVDGLVVGQMTTAPYTLNWTPSTWGNFTITAVATDTLGNASLTSAPVTITAFDDVNHDGLPDWWKAKYGLPTGATGASLATNGTGLTNLQCYQMGINPVDYYQGVAPQVFIVGGNGQVGAASTFLSQPLQIKVTNTAGIGAPYAPVTFSVNAGGISSTNSGSAQTSLSTHADAFGQATIYFKLPATGSGPFTITATAGTSPTVGSVAFTEYVATSTVGLTITPTIITTPPSTTLTLMATVSPTPGSVALYEGQQLLMTVPPPYTASLPNVSPGPHTYTVLALTGSNVTGSASASYTVPLPVDPIANYRFTRGNGTNQAYLSSVIAVGYEQGFKIDNTGTGQFPSGPLPWFMKVGYGGTNWYHINVNPTTGVADYNTIQFQNPIVAFGASTGKAPLYTKQNYSFGIAAGGQNGIGIDSGNTGFAYGLMIQVYSKSYPNAGPLVTAYVALPKPNDSQYGDLFWNYFVSNGYIADVHLTTNSTPTVTGGLLVTNYDTTTLDGLKLSPPLPIDFDTQVQFTPPVNYEQQWGMPVPNADYSNWGLIVSHKSGNSDLEYQISYFGTVDGAVGTLPLPLAAVHNQGLNDAVPNLSYTLDFTDRPSWSSTFLSQPQFTGQPLPPQYQGKTTQELLKVSTPVTVQFSAPSSDPNSAYRALNDTASPELRPHPILDKFVSDMGSDPIALTNYVINNIQLCDAVSYNDDPTSGLTDTSINEGGVSRGALGTFLEKEGNPAEQCALLIYFLRKCNIPCGYVFAPHDTMSMLNMRMSTLLRMQLNGAVNGDPNSSDTTSVVPQPVNVNYPWVAAYINSQWVHIFPWIKDTSITEGGNLSDYLPPGYQTGPQWLQAYLSMDTKLLPFVTPTGTTAIASAKITGLSSNNGIVAGCTVQSSASAFPAGTTVVSVDSPTQVTVSNNATVAGNSTMTVGQTWATLPQDNPGYLYPLWLDRQLAASGMSQSDVGVTIFDRRNNFNSWSDMPQPFALDTSTYNPTTHSWDVNLLPTLSQLPTVNGISQIFDTIDLFAFSDQNNSGTYHGTEPYWDSGTIPILDLHTRRFMIREARVDSSNLNMQMSLESYRTGGGAGSTTFAAGDPLINKQFAQVPLTDASDKTLQLRVTYNRHRKLPASFFPGTTFNPVPDPWTVFMGIEDQEQIVQTRPFRNGDAIALCIDAGRVTQDMLNVQASRNFGVRSKMHLFQPAYGR